MPKIIVIKILNILNFSHKCSILNILSCVKNKLYINELKKEKEFCYF